MSVESRDIGSMIYPFNSIVPQATTTTANIAGSSFDRYAGGAAVAGEYGSSVNGQAMPMSCQFTLESSNPGATNTYKVTLQDSADNSSFADYVDPYTGVAAKTATITAASAAAMGFAKADLTNARRYVRLYVHTADFVAGGDAIVSGSIIFGGQPELDTLGD